MVTSLVNHARPAGRESAHGLWSFGVNDTDHPKPPDAARSSHQFQATHWTLVLAAGQGAANPELARKALAELCRIYWYPVYAFIRQRRSSEAEAMDLTQEFFTRQLELDSFRLVDRQKGRFRSWLFAAVKNFLSNQYVFDTRIKRDKRATLEFDAIGGEQQYRAESGHNYDPERMFHRRFALSLLQHVLQELRAQYEKSGRARLFEELSGFLPGEHELQEPQYQAFGARLGMTPNAVKVAVHRLRQDYGKLMHSWLQGMLEVLHAV